MWQQAAQKPTPQQQPAPPVQANAAAAQKQVPTQAVKQAPAAAPPQAAKSQPAQTKTPAAAAVPVAQQNSQKQGDDSRVPVNRREETEPAVKLEFPTKSILSHTTFKMGAHNVNGTSEEAAPPAVSRNKIIVSKEK